MLDENELHRKRPVWNALSMLYLDTELQEEDFAWIARVCNDSGFTAAELEKILKQEVAPVVSGNLFVTAGTWGGFNSEWLEAEICKNTEAKPFIRLPQLLKRVYESFITWPVKKEWAEISSRLSHNNPMPNSEK